MECTVVDLLNILSLIIIATQGSDSPSEKSRSGGSSSGVLGGDGPSRSSVAMELGGDGELGDDGASSMITIPVTAPSAKAAP